MEQFDNSDDNGPNSDETQLAPRRNTTVSRGMLAASLSTENAATAALVAKARADIEARWVMAIRNPRHLDDVRQNMIRECKRRGFAQQAIYKIPIGGQTVEGLTIRFAEVAARCMGNMPVEVVTIYDSDLERIVRVTVTDLESNVTWSRDITVRKTIERKSIKRGQVPISQRTNAYGEPVYIVPASDDEVAVKEAALVSKAARTGILRIIPGHLQDEMFDLCKATIAEAAAKDPDGERVKMLDAFAGINVMPSDLEQYLGHDTTKISPAEVTQLRGLFTAIRDGETTWPAVLEAKLAGKPAPAAAPAPASAPAPGTAQPAAPATNAQPNAGAAQPATAPKGGKRGGASALKDQLKGDTKPAPAPAASAPPASGAPAREASSFDKAAADARAKEAQRAQGGDPREAEPGWMAGETHGATPNGGEPVVEEVPDFEERKCAGCGAVIECAKAEPPGAKCYACRQA